MSGADDFLETETVQAVDLLDDLKDMIRWASSNQARSLQRTLGPSEVGHPCDRKLAMGLMQERGGNRYSDPWASIVGTAVHTWLESAAQKHNEKLGRIRWITEQRVGRRLPGTCDLYDMDTATVTDWKNPGPTAFAKFVKNGPGPGYRTQAHIYGYGYVELGFPVKNVAICALPRAAQLSKAKLWMEPYDETVALNAFARIDRVTEKCVELDVEHHPERYRLIEHNPSDDCQLCNFWSPNPQGPTDCGGLG